MKPFTTPLPETALLHDKSDNQYCLDRPGCRFSGEDRLVIGGSGGRQRDMVFSAGMTHADTQRTDDAHKLLSYFPPELDFEGNLVRVPRDDFTTASVDVKKYVAWLKANGYALAGR
jgi:hypothetical protein